MLELGVKSLIAYLLGSLIGALLIGGARGIDIREQGSGNAGGTNALRTQGFGFAAAVVAIDVGKGMLAAGWLPVWEPTGLAADPSVNRAWLAAACATAAVAGHVWPLYFDFRGGKGGATLVGAWLALAPAVVPVAIAAWLAVAMLSGYAGLATIVAVATIPLAVRWLGVPSVPLLALAVAMVVFIAWTHRGNIAGMLHGSEARLARLWLLRPRDRRA